MKVVLIGHGGHSKVISDIIRPIPELQIIGYLDNKYEVKQVINNVILGPVKAAKEIKDAHGNVKFIIAIGDNRTRKLIAEQLNFLSTDYISLAHQSASISPSVTIGYGSVIMPQAVVNSDAIIGNHCILNSCSVVEHDSILEDFVHICPNTTIAGTVKLGQGTFVGSGATVIPNKIIGEWSTIGAGATVIDHLPENCLAVGTPAKVKRKEKVNAG
ncbi:acetyltransferase [Bacillus sp. ISL-41]|uniref:acetyltransferase n=1 Tax=Bacillus sp. ISL-41 TaxID=2819127 RepID=UPI001BEB5AF0|nr:acetyltransferase [Bacillus sp. ISL-41]MBT2642194.1 acetyltransferase [Bacillus sp. ISL-41]